jgi:hypothetical protein
MNTPPITGRQFKLTPADALQAATMLETGRAKAVAAHFKVTTMTLYSTLKREGLFKPKPQEGIKRKLSDEELAHAMNMYFGNKSMKTICSFLDVSEKVMRREFVAAGLQNRVSGPKPGTTPTLYRSKDVEPTTAWCGDLSKQMLSVSLRVSHG